MKKRALVLVLVVAVLLVSASIVGARTELAELTVKNQSAHPVYLYLVESEEVGNKSFGQKEYQPVEGGEAYYLVAPAGQDTVFDVERTFYAYTLNACSGDKIVSDHVDLANGGELRVPKLCEFFWIDYEEKLVVDDILTRSEDIKFTLANNSANTVYVVLSGPETVSLQIEAGNTRDIVVEGGTYTMTANPCEGGSVSVTQQFFFHRTYDVCAP